MKRRKRQPVGWIGPSIGRGPGTSLGKGQWRVIDSTGQWIASGFTTRAYALRWIDGFNLLQVGQQLSDDDQKWIFAHWYAHQRKRTRKPIPTESGKAVLTTTQTKAEAQTVAGDYRNKSGQV